jgi:hypothetical protein
VFEAHELVLAKAKVTNTGCNLNVHRVEFVLEQ